MSAPQSSGVVWVIRLSNAKGSFYWQSEEAMLAWYGPMTKASDIVGKPAHRPRLEHAEKFTSYKAARDRLGFLYHAFNYSGYDKMPNAPRLSLLTVQQAQALDEAEVSP